MPDVTETTRDMRNEAKNRRYGGSRDERQRKERDGRRREREIVDEGRREARDERRWRTEMKGRETKGDAR